MNIEQGEDDLSLEDALNAALDGEKPAEVAEQQEAPPEGETPEQEQARYVREGRRFVKEQKEEPKEGKEAAVAQEQQTPPKEKRPTWYKDEYGDWSKLPENFRNALRDQEKAYAQGIAQHSTKAKAAEAWEPINQALAPHLQELAAAGSNPQQYVRQLIESAEYLRTDPVRALNWLCQQYTGGYDIQQLADWMAQQGIQAEKTDPVKQELAQLRQQVQQLSQLPQKQQMQALNTQIAEWSRDKTDFAAVRGHMAMLAKLNPGSSLDQLYAEAQWAHPEIRERILAEREDKRVKELAGKRQAGAQSPRPNGANGANTPSYKNMTVEEELAMHLDGGV